MPPAQLVRGAPEATARLDGLIAAARGELASAVRRPPPPRRQRPRTPEAGGGREHPDPLPFGVFGLSALGFSCVLGFRGWGFRV